MVCVVETLDERLLRKPLFLPQFLESGQHFCRSFQKCSIASCDKKLENIDSGQLLTYVKQMLDKHNYRINNIDSVIIAEQPTFAPYILDMRERIADILNIDFDRVSIKATTEDGLGFTGNGQGIAAYAVVGIEN